MNIMPYILNIKFSISLDQTRCPIYAKNQALDCDKKKSKER